MANKTPKELSAASQSRSLIEGEKWSKIQTAEGWKRSYIKKLQEEKRKKKDHS